MPIENEEDLVLRHVKRYDRLKGDRGTWESHWQDVCNYTLPIKSVITSTRTPGQEVENVLHDSTAVDSNEKFATGMYNHMTPPGKRWFMMATGDGEEEGAQDKDMLASATDTLHEQINISNFPMEIFDDYLDLGTIGTGNIYIDQGDNSPLCYQTRHISEYVIAEDAYGRVDTCYLKFKHTVRQAVQRWGKENLGEKILKALEDGDLDKNFDFLHVQAPNENYNEYSRVRDNWNMPYDSLWVSLLDKKLVKRSGVRDLRYIVHRFMKGTGEMYGRSPGMKRLPEGRTLNDIVKITLANAEMKIAPSILAASGMFDEPPVIQANGIIQYTPGLGNLKPEPWNTGSDVKLGLEMEEQKRDSIMRGFYNDIFMILSDEKRRTATEVLEIMQEKMNLLSPNFGRLKSELYDRLVEVSLHILLESGYLQLPVGLRYRIEYISTLALALKFNEIRAWGNVFASISPLVEIDPSVLDNYSLDEISRGIAENEGLPSKWLRSITERDAIRAQRQKQQQEMMALQIAQEAAKTYPSITKKAEAGSPAAALMGAA